VLRAGGGKSSSVCSASAGSMPNRCPRVPLGERGRERVLRCALSLRMDAGVVPAPEAETPQENGCAGVSALLVPPVPVASDSFHADVRAVPSRLFPTVRSPLVST
jgi:hypothetical protein